MPVDGHGPALDQNYVPLRSLPEIGGPQQMTFSVSDLTYCVVEFNCMGFDLRTRRDGLEV